MKIDEAALKFRRDFQIRISIAKAVKELPETKDRDNHLAKMRNGTGMCMSCFMDGIIYLKKNGVTEI